jgi:hypothetical protein
VASIAIKKQMSSGFAGEHADAYQTGTIMAFILLCAVIIGISGCFAIHAHHTAKPDGTKPPAAKAADKQKKIAPAAFEVGDATRACSHATRACPHATRHAHDRARGTVRGACGASARGRARRYAQHRFFCQA